ncbi:MAG: choice-of-anchor tandem repeat GloVer-containing protein [Terriglobia bacterium]|jgi:uncharacterized repeat protein (TIGR03803 family)
MQNRSINRGAVLVVLLAAAATASSALAQEANFSTLYLFEAPAANTSTSALGSQPDTTPAVGPDGAIYGMTTDGGQYGTGVIYRFDPDSHQYTVLHTFSATDANGDNADGASPGNGLTRGPDDVFYGMAYDGGQNGTGTVFEITASGTFTVLHTFSALDANGHNADGGAPLRTIVVGRDGNLYGTTRLGGENSCGIAPFVKGCGVAWVMDRWGNNFKVIHQFVQGEGHAASLLQAQDGFLYGCGVWPGTSTPSGAPLPSGILFRMATSGSPFQVLYTFSQTDANGENTDGADCYEPLVEAEPGVFYGAAGYGGSNGNGVVFRYSLRAPGMVDVVHDFSATTAGANWDGAGPDGPLALGPDRTLYSNADYGGMNGNGVIYSIRPDGFFEVLHTFSATNPTTGANWDGVNPDDGVVLDGNKLIGIAIYGGNGSPAGLANSGGTLYELRLYESGYGGKGQP